MKRITPIHVFKFLIHQVQIFLHTLPGWALRDLYFTPHTVYFCILSDSHCLHPPLTLHSENLSFWRKHSLFSVKNYKKIYTQCRLMLWVRRLVAGVSSPRSGFDAERDCVKVLQMFLLVLRLFPASTIPPVLIFIYMLLVSGEGTVRANTN